MEMVVIYRNSADDRYAIENKTVAPIEIKVHIYRYSSFFF